MEPDSKRARVEGPRSASDVVQDLLQRLRLQEYLPRFLENGFDMLEAVLEMDSSDMLEEVGMSSEHAQLLEAEITRLREGGSGTGASPSTAAAVHPPPPPQAAASPSSSQAAGRPTSSLQTAPPPPPPPGPSSLSTLPPGPPVSAAPPPPPAPALPPAPPPPPTAAHVVFPPGNSVTAALLGGTLPAAAGLGSFGTSPAHSGNGSSSGCGCGAPVGCFMNEVQQQVQALLVLIDESACLVQASSAFCGNPASGPVQVATVAEAAQQALQRSLWGLRTLEKLEQRQSELGCDISSLSPLTQMARSAVKIAEEAGQTCKSLAANVRDSCMESLKTRKSRVPCKNYLAGRCSKGETCDFSHDSEDLAARPIMLKSMKQCIFHAKGSCMRGPACPFAHGEEESREIEKYVEVLRKEKRQTGGLPPRH